MSEENQQQDVDGVTDSMAAVAVVVIPVIAVVYWLSGLPTSWVGSDCVKWQSAYQPQQTKELNSLRVYELKSLQAKKANELKS